MVPPWVPQEVPLWATLAAPVVPPWVPPMVLLVAPLTSVPTLRPHASSWHSSRSLAGQVDPQQLGQVDHKVADQVRALTLEALLCVVLNIVVHVVVSDALLSLLSLWSFCKHKCQREGSTSTGDEESCSASLIICGASCILQRI